MDILEEVNSRCREGIKFDEVSSVEDEFFLLEDPNFTYGERNMYCTPLRSEEELTQVLKILWKYDQPYVIVSGSGETQDEYFKGHTIFIPNIER